MQLLAEPAENVGAARKESASSYAVAHRKKDVKDAVAFAKYDGHS